MEQWKDIPGYEKIYQASNLGNIRTCEGKTTVSVRHGIRHWKQRILKQKKQKNRYGRMDARVALYKDKKGKTFLVSRLIAMTWCDGYSDGMTVNHIDGNSLNNTVENLEWVSRADNIRKGFSDGLYKTMEKTIIVESNGTTHVFDSMSQASIYFGKSPGYFSNLMKSGRTISPESGICLIKIGR